MILLQQKQVVLEKSLLLTQQIYMKKVYMNQLMLTNWKQMKKTSKLRNVIKENQHCLIH